MRVCQLIVAVPEGPSTWEETEVHKIRPRLEILSTRIFSIKCNHKNKSIWTDLIRLKSTEIDNLPLLKKQQVQNNSPPNMESTQTQP